MTREPSKSAASAGLYPPRGREAQQAFARERRQRKRAISKLPQPLQRAAARLQEANRPANRLDEANTLGGRSSVHATALDMGHTMYSAAMQGLMSPKLTQKILGPDKNPSGPLGRMAATIRTRLNERGMRKGAVKHARHKAMGG